MIELDYGPVTTQVRAPREVCDWLGTVLTVVNPDGLPPLVSFWNSDSQTFLSGHLSLIEAALTLSDLRYVVHNRPMSAHVPNPDCGILKTPQQPGFTLHRYQASTTRKMVTGQRGGVQLATGAGKTACYLASLVWLQQLLSRPVRSLTIVPTTNLASQMADRMLKSGLNAKIFTKGKWGSADHVVAVINGLYNLICAGQKSVVDMLHSRDVLCFDEGHHSQAEMFYTLGLNCPAPFRWNLSATLYANRANPYAHPGDMKIIGLTGPTLAVIPARFLWENKFVPKPKITFVPVDYPDAKYAYGYQSGGHWNDCAVWRGVGKDAAKIGVEWDLIVNNDWRNILARRVCYWALADNPDSKVVILVQRLDHGEILQRMLWAAKVDAVCCFGGQKVVTLDRHGTSSWWVDKNDRILNEFQAGERRVIIGSQKFDEGQSFPEFTDLILAQAGRGGEANRRVYQRVGRAMHAQTQVRVTDFYDRTHRMVRAQADARLMALHNEGYPVEVGWPDEVRRPIPGISEVPMSVLGGR